MDTRKVATEYRLSKWAQIIQKRQDCGQSIKDFCESEGISKNTYFYWQRKLREAACAGFNSEASGTGLVPNGWARLDPHGSITAGGTLTIEVGGCRLTANGETEPELLLKVCRALKSL